MCGTMPNSRKQILVHIKFKINIYLLSSILFTIRYSHMKFLKEIIRKMNHIQDFKFHNGLKIRGRKRLAFSILTHLQHQS